VTPFKSLRIKQIRFTVRLLSALEAMPGGGFVMRQLANWPLTAPILNGILGYHRAFDSFSEAITAAQPYAKGGHENPLGVTVHLSLAAVPRPSDYAALFHMQNLITGRFKVFDLGGNVGNLFYCYNKYLNFPLDLVWQVYELPDVIEKGQRIAAERGETRLRFTQNWSDASGADLLLASGSIHYFDPPVSQMVAKLPNKPSHILVNRSPLIEGPATATVQEGDDWRVGCILYNRAQVIAAFEAIGYELIDSWQAAERSLIIIGKPECSAAPYSGLYFRLKPQG
jgi:putative methyltransferase (TIGR04325 family)